MRKSDSCRLVAAASLFLSMSAADAAVSPTFDVKPRKAAPPATCPCLNVQNALLAAHPGRTTLGANVDNITERLQRLYAVKIAALPIFARLRARITRSPQTRDR
jgi:hypothetical protein